MASNAPIWVRLEADGSVADLRLQRILAYPDSFIADMARQALEDADAEGSSLVSIRLDCSSEVLREVVEYIRASDGLYEFPEDAKLRARVRIQLDFLGLNQSSSAQETLIILDPTGGRGTGLPQLFKYQLDPSTTLPSVKMSSGLPSPARQHTATVCQHVYGGKRLPCQVEWMMTKAVKDSGMCAAVTIDLLAQPDAFGYDRHVANGS